MSDPTRPVTRVRRPVLNQPAAPKPDSDPDPHDAAEMEAERAAIQAESREAEQAAAQAAVAQREARAEPPPLPGAVRSEIRREGHAGPIPAGFEAREGDVLVLTYSEVTLPLPKQYAMMKFGGAIYTRKLCAGDDVEKERVAISAWLTRVVEADGVAKYRRMVSDFLRNKGLGE